MMEKYFHPEPAPDSLNLDSVATTVLAQELKLRRLAEAADEPIIQTVAQSDGLAPLLHLIVSNVIPII